MQCFTLLRVYKSRRYQKNMERETNEFINDLRRRKPAAQRRLLADYGPMVFRLVMRMVGQTEDAEEVYQDVFVKALTKISFFDERKASLATWLSRIAYNESVNHIRSRRMDFVLIDDNEMETAVEDIPSVNHDDEQVVLLLERAMALLPTAEQMLLSLFYYENRSLQEIAYITDSKPTTIGSRLSRIRKKLYGLIQQFSEQ